MDDYEGIPGMSPEIDEDEAEDEDEEEDDE